MHVEHDKTMAEHERVMQEHHWQMERHRQMTLWVHFVNMVLGVWLILSPFALGYLDASGLGADIARVQAERQLSDPALRNAVMGWSDAIGGVLVLVFSALALARRGWAQWANVFVGIWLLFAPLLFWTPSPAVYANDTLVGSLVITFAILIPMMPGMSMEAMAFGADVPPGWNYSPSTWVQRLPIIALALVGFFIARYLAAYQLGHITHVWDPFFGTGTAKIITSRVSRAWPIPDAGLGALSYMLEALSGIMGSARRWRTMPWMVAMFGVLVVPLGGVSIFFIIIQPIVIGTWCTLCLIAALAMVMMIPYALDEIVAMVEFLMQCRREGKPFWSIFWHGGTLQGGGEDQSPTLGVGSGSVIKGMFKGGVNYPWTLVVSIILGITLMFTRLLFNNEGAMANSDHLIGSLVVTFTFAAAAEAARPVRFINILFGVWLIAAPWLLTGVSAIGTWASVVIGLALIALAFPRGPIRARYGVWDRYIV